MADTRKTRNTRAPGPAPAPTPQLEAMAAFRELAPELAGMRELVPRAQANTGIEIQVVREFQPAQKKPWRAAEVWTKNRVYGLDSMMNCFEILDRSTGRPEASHSMLGSRLGGGRLRSAESVRFSYPFPLPGMEAMFTQGKKYGYTSMVERFVLRIRMLTTDEEHVPTWEEIAGRWSASRAKK
jgi:hypothetical protein